MHVFLFYIIMLETLADLMLETLADLGIQEFFISNPWWLI